MSIDNNFVFPKWTNYIPVILLMVVGGGAIGAHLLFGIFASPNFYEVGYSPNQPIPFSHKLHVSELGLECLYCHSGAEKSSVAGIPATEVCMRCHSSVKTDSLKLKPLFYSVKNDKALKWTRVYRLPDHVHFPHKAHVQVGIACQECHGDVDHMEKLTVASPLSMGWCLNCHRKVRGVPETVKTLEIKKWEKVADKGKSVFVPGTRHHDEIDPPLNCSGCHQ